MPGGEAVLARLTEARLLLGWIFRLELFWLKSRGFPLNPPKVKLFAGGSTPRKLRALNELFQMCRTSWNWNWKVVQQQHCCRGPVAQAVRVLRWTRRDCTGGRS